MSTLRFPKPKTERNPAYLRWVRSQPCHTCRRWAEHAHHVEAGGTGIKGPDTATVPLCSRCHVQLHRIGQKEFERGKQVDLEYEARRLYRLYAGEGAA